MLELRDGQRLHLVLGTSAKEALGSFRADGGSRSLWFANDYRKDDLLLTVLDSRPRMLLCLERAGSDSRPGTFDIAELYAFPTLLAVRAVTTRLGSTLPRV